MMKKIQIFAMAFLSFALLSASLIPGDALPEPDLSSVLNNSLTQGSLPVIQAPCSVHGKLSSVCQPHSTVAHKKPGLTPVTHDSQEQSFMTTNRSLANYRAYPITSVG